MADESRSSGPLVYSMECSTVTEAPASMSAATIFALQKASEFTRGANTGLIHRILICPAVAIDDMTRGGYGNAAQEWVFTAKYAEMASIILAVAFPSPYGLCALDIAA